MSDQSNRPESPQGGQQPSQQPWSMPLPQQEPSGAPQPTPSGQQPYGSGAAPTPYGSAPPAPGGAVPPDPYTSAPPAPGGAMPPVGYAAPTAGAPGGPTRKSRTPLIVGVVVGALVLIAGVGGVIAVTNANRAAEEERQAEAQAAADRVTGATAAVQGFLDAVVANDSATALTFVEQVGGNGDLLTDEVLAASAELGPISEVVVTPPAEITEYYLSADIEVSYLVGETEVVRTYRSSDLDEDGTWLLEDALSPASLYAEYGDLELLLNGAPVPAEEFVLFPGSYEFGIATEYFTLGEETTFVAADPYLLDIPTPVPALTDEGVTVFRETVRAAVDECVASTKLETGCGLSIPATLGDGTVLTDGTIERTLTDDAAQTLESMVPTLAYDNPAVAEGEFIGVVEVVAEGTQDGNEVRGDVIGPPTLGVPSINMTDPELTVTWS